MRYPVEDQPEKSSGDDDQEPGDRGEDLVSLVAEIMNEFLVSFRRGYL